MTKKSSEERLFDLQKKEEELEKKRAQIVARKKQLEQQIKAQERKERTHRLITIGAIFEHHWGTISPEKAEKLAFSLRENAREIIDDDK